MKKSQALSLFLSLFLSFSVAAKETGGIPETICNQPADEFFAKLNRLKDAMSCRSATSLAMCSALIGSAGLGTVMARQGANSAARIRNPAPNTCGFSNNSIEVLPNYVWSGKVRESLLGIFPAYARGCSFMMRDRANTYIQNTQNFLNEVRDRESAALGQLIGSASPNLDVPTDTFDNYAMSRSTYETYVGLLEETAQMTLDGVDTDSAGRALFSSQEKAERIKEILEIAREDLAKDSFKSEKEIIWLKERLMSELGSDYGEINRSLHEAYVDRLARAAASLKPLSDLSDIFEGRGPSPAPAYLSPEQNARIRAAKRANPDLAPVIDRALEARRNLAIANHQLNAYGEAARRLQNPRTIQQVSQNGSRAIYDILGDLQHFDYEGAQHDRFLLGNLEPGGMQRGYRTGVGYFAEMTPPGYNNPNFHNNPATRQLGPKTLSSMKTGSALSKTGGKLVARAGLSVAAGFATAGMSLAGEAAIAIATPGPAGMCSDVNYPPELSDDKGCPIDLSLSSPELHEFGTLPQSLIAEKANNFPRTCYGLEELVDKYGPKSFTGSCDGSGFRVTSRGRRGGRDLEFVGQFAPNSGEVSQVSMFGNKTFEKGGVRAIRFDKGRPSSVLIPNRAWSEGMATDPRGTMDFQRAETFDVIPMADLVKGMQTGSTETSNTSASLDFLSEYSYVISDVSNCCTGIGAISKKICDAYGISRSSSGGGDLMSPTGR